jgi:hypothetical protein
MTRPADSKRFKPASYAENADKRPRQPSIPQPSGEPTEFDKHPRRFPIRPKASKNSSGGRLILIYDMARDCPAEC